VELVTIRLKPIEPLMLREPGEFDSSSRGAYSYALSLSIPRPSVVVGALISTLMPLSKKEIPNCSDVSGWEDLLGCYIRIFDELGIEAIRGPYIIDRKRQELLVPILLGKRLWLLDYNQARYIFLLLEEYGDILERIFREKDSAEKTVAILRLVEDSIESSTMRKYVAKIITISRTGIHLKSRGSDEIGKVTREGYMYTANYIAYPPDTEIMFLAVVKSTSSIVDLLQSEIAMKFGGEERIVKALIEHASENNIVLNLLSQVENTGVKYAVLTSPMPLKDTELNISFVGEYTTIGYGFSLAKKRRKPLISSLSEGSIVEISGRKLSHEEMLHHGLYSALGLTKISYYKHMGKLGYASFTPLM